MTDWIPFEEGEYWVEQGYGLRSRVTEPATASSNGVKVSKEKLALSILGAVLSGANKSGSATTAQPQAQVSKPSAIETRARISNAFAATLQMSSWKADGTFEIAVNQGLGGAAHMFGRITGDVAGGKTGRALGFLV